MNGSGSSKNVPSLAVIDDVEWKGWMRLTLAKPSGIHPRLFMAMLGGMSLRGLIPVLLGLFVIPTRRLQPFHGYPDRGFQRLTHDAWPPACNVPRLCGGVLQLSSTWNLLS